MAHSRIICPCVNKRSALAVTNDINAKFSSTSDALRYPVDVHRFTESSGNVFADLGLPEPGTRLVKAELARGISAIIGQRGLTQTEAAALLGIDQPKVSAITRGRLGNFSLERLLVLVNRLGVDIDIEVSPNPEPSRSPRMAVHRAGKSLAASRDVGSSESVRFEESHRVSR